MATLKQRLQRKNSSGSYDIIHLETEWNCITGKPTTFPPDSHSHSEYSLTSHTHNYAASNHNHAASNITSGVLPVRYGGTGTTSLAQLARNLFSWAKFTATGDYTSSIKGPANTRICFVTGIDDVVFFMIFRLQEALAIRVNGPNIDICPCNTFPGTGEWEPTISTTKNHTYYYLFI